MTFVMLFIEAMYFLFSVTPPLMIMGVSMSIVNFTAMKSMPAPIHPSIKYKRISITGTSYTEKYIIRSGLRICKTFGIL
jgi:hypothetical protein